MTIKDWPEGERPRERLLAHGASVLSDAELLALFLGTGSTGRSAIDVGRAALAHFGGLNALLQASPDRYREVPGLGPARYARLHAVVELARRALDEDVRRDTVLNSPDKVRVIHKLVAPAV